MSNTDECTKVHLSRVVLNTSNPAYVALRREGVLFGGVCGSTAHGNAHNNRQGNVTHIILPDGWTVRDEQVIVDDKGVVRAGIVNGQLTLPS